MPRRKLQKSIPVDGAVEPSAEPSVDEAADAQVLTTSGFFEYCRLYNGQTITLEATLKQLQAFGYTRVDHVMDPGEFALRGGVLDIFPATFETPLRIELHGSRIASIRSFNPQSLETLERHSLVIVLPAHLRMRPSIEVPFEAFVDVQEGDYIVHLDHGIGRFLRKESIHGAKGLHDAFLVEYADGDRLYVPLDQVHLIQKYVSLGNRPPRLHKLGGTAWERAKVKAFTSAVTYARTLLEVQAKRVTLPGHAFAKDNEWQQAFEAAFPFRETPDQLTAVADVKRDMEAARPMDRMLLGDVGYGKTEVAIRAAFKAVMDGKQVAVLVPTTILAYQHYRTFRKRLEGFPVRVEMLSRFQSDADQRRIVADLAAGGCDIVIGTHRLLSTDIRFHDIGLLVIDEEQRFGVKDKERLKEWRTQLDVLSLSATPIPRTLYLSLVGAREMSLIATPPEHRHPIDTHIMEEDDASVRQWIRREVSRGGQVYVVFNRVQGIQQVAQKLADLVPEARIAVAHGQMHEDALEQVMVAFMDGRVDVLLTTTIIESGIDIPNANTLIVYRADRFGLADLYQLRGRVGRFDRKAYAHLLVPKQMILTQDALKRLQAMTTHTALGSGFKIAMEDLKIRGAGNLLGVEQSGHISAVGFDLYCRLLREAVESMKKEDPAFHAPRSK